MILSKSVLKSLFIIISTLSVAMSAKSGEGDVRWIFETESLTWSSPAVGADGTVYFGGTADENGLFALNPDGSNKWTFTVTEKIISSPAVSSDGIIYTDDPEKRDCLALNSDGTLKWRFHMGAQLTSSPSIGPDGTIYAASEDHHLYALTPEGRLKWAFELQGPERWASPAIASDGTIYVGCHDNCLYSIKPNGSLKWAFKTGGIIQSSPAIGVDGTVYISSYDAYLYALNSDGVLQWKFRTGRSIWASPVIAPDGTVYIPSQDGKLYALDAEGLEKWVYNASPGIDTSTDNPHQINTTPVIGDDGTVYIGTVNFDIHAVNPDGTLKWRKDDMAWGVEYSPAMGPDGTLYIPAKHMYAVETASAGLADSPWPMYNHDAAHSGRAPVTETGKLTVSPSSVSLLKGDTINVSVFGGTAPHSVSVDNEKIATAFWDGDTITVSGRSEGVTSVTLTDSAGTGTDVRVNVIEHLVPEGTVVLEDIRIGAVIDTVDKGEIEAEFLKGGESTTARGDRVLWGHFYADPSEVSWGSIENPDVFVKVWMDAGGRTDVNYFHVSVPNIYVFTDFSNKGLYDEQDTALMTSRRYIRHCREDGKTYSETTFENGMCAYAPKVGCQYNALYMEPVYNDITDKLAIDAIIDTVEAGPSRAVWRQGGTGVTERGDTVIWGLFYADPRDVLWGSEDNPDIFVKIWFDVQGALYVNFFHVSVPDINVYMSYPHVPQFSDEQEATAYTFNRYIRFQAE